MRSAGRLIPTLVLCTNIILAFEASVYSNDVKIRHLDSQSVGWLISYHSTLRSWFGTVSAKRTNEVGSNVL
jgi:hypothetical protein